MKKVVLLLAATLLSLNVGAQITPKTAQLIVDGVNEAVASTQKEEIWQVTRFWHKNTTAGLKSSKMYFIVKNKEVFLKIKNKQEGSFKVISDNGTSLVFESGDKFTEHRYTLTRSEKHPSVKQQIKDEFSGEVTEFLYSIRKIN